MLLALDVCLFDAFA
ncbi:DUF645 family protein [Vibrio cholerae]|nr:DUF645 family protein [Vibrio cholerae]